MSWIKKIIGASVLTSLFFIAPEKALAETCVSCGLYNTGGYNLYVLGQNLNSVVSCAMPTQVASPMVVPVYLSNPTGYLSSFTGSGGCGTFTQSCGSCYDTLGFGGYGTLPMTPSIDSQLFQLISYQNVLLNQLSNPVLGSYPTLPTTYPNYSYNPSVPPVYPFNPFNPYSPVGPYLPSGPTIPSIPTNPYDNSIPFPTTPSLPYGGCDNVTVMCPQPGVNTFENTFPGGSGSSGGTVTDLVPLPTYTPSIGAGSLPSNQYQIPRGLRRHR
ncbi:MAG: hypothetical protein EBQ92_10960 [Proteobacteria bacterium]|nr:hypothetical protein [Pseudomonadota bacterium]